MGKVARRLTVTESEENLSGNEICPIMEQDRAELPITKVFNSTH